jgi:hypothetical protein
MIFSTQQVWKQLSWSAVVSAVFSGGAIALSACAPSHQTLQSPPLSDPKAAIQSANVVAQVVQPRKVDILFVIDTSESMDVHQDRVRAHIEKFVGSFKNHVDLDFHIGVVSIWDSRTYSSPNQKVTPYPLGQLRPLKDPSQPGAHLPGPQYVTRSPNFAQVLGESLDIGVEHFKDGGPQKEELFSPIMPALTQAQNADFYRADANLAIILLTDADDSTPNLTASQLRDQLVALKGGNADMVSVYAILSIGKSCPVDPGRVEDDGTIRDPINIQGLVEMTGGSIANLCQTSEDNFGSQLAKIGSSIESKGSSLVLIPLSLRPDPTTFQVVYILPNGKVVYLVAGDAYSYDEISNQIQIHRDSAVIAANPGGQVKIAFTPLDPLRVRTGRVHRIGR